MAKIKVKVTEKKKKIQLPCILIEKDHQTIIIATELKDGLYTGTVIKQNSIKSRPFGYHGNVWIAEGFTPFNGKITLEQEYNDQSNGK